MQRSNAIQAMRGVAATFVFVLHLFMFQAGFQSSGAMFGLTRVAATFGGSGVDIFFVLSGYLMYLIAQKPGRSGSMQSALQFAFSRLMRIYPPFFLSMLFSFAVYLYFGGLHDAQSKLSLSALLLTRTHNDLNPVSWSLAHEVYFYACVFVAMLLPVSFRLAFWGWAIAQVAYVMLAMWVIPSIGIPILWPAWNVEFLVGAVVAAVIYRGIIYRPRAVLFAGVALFAAAIVLSWFAEGPSGEGALSGWQRVFGFAIPAGMILYGLLLLEREGRWRASRLWVALGDMSYSLYLFHVPVIWLLLFWSVKHGLYDLIPRPFYVLIFAPFCLLVSFSVYRWFERPVTDWAHARVRSWRVARSVALTPASR